MGRGVNVNVNEYGNRSGLNMILFKVEKMCNVRPSKNSKTHATMIAQNNRCLFANMPMGTDFTKGNLYSAIRTEQLKETIIKDVFAAFLLHELNIY